VVVHLDAPLEVCRLRDQEGLYGAADAGEIANFPGVSAGYEPPEDADLVLRTDQTAVRECVERVLTLLRKRKFIDA
jgi:adenylylsulfate kinase-like enzyme